MAITFSNDIQDTIQLSKSWIISLLTLLFFSIGATVFIGELYFLLVPFVVLFGKIIYDHPKLLFWTFILCIPISAEISFSNGLSLSLPDEPMMIGILGIMICVVIYNFRMLPEWLWQSPIIAVIILQYIWTIVTVMYAQDVVLASKFLLAKTWFLSSFVLFTSMFIRSKNDIKRMFLLFSIPVLIHSVFAFLLHASQDFGYWESNTVVRPFYRNHVDYGSILSMVFPVFFIMILMKKEWDWKKYLLIGVFIFLIIAVSVAYSRAAILAAIFSIIVFFAIKKKLVNWIIPGMLTFFTVVIIFLAQNNNFIEFRPNKSQNATQETFIETVMGAFTGKDMSSMERFYRWIASARMSQEHPVVGVGPNNWYFHYKPHAVNAFKTWVSRNEERSTTHNYFILMLTEQGWPAVILYATLIILLLHTGQKTYHRFTDPIYKYYTMATVMIIAACFVNNFFSEFLETHKVGGMFWIAVTVLAFLRHKSIEHQKLIK